MVLAKITIWNKYNSWLYRRKPETAFAIISLLTFLEYRRARFLIHYNNIVSVDVNYRVNERITTSLINWRSITLLLKELYRNGNVYKTENKAYAKITKSKKLSCFLSQLFCVRSTKNVPKELYQLNGYCLRHSL